MVRPCSHGSVSAAADLGYGIIIDVVKVHKEFLQTYGKSAAEVPLLSFDPYNWREPFTTYGS